MRKAYRILTVIIAVTLMFTLPSTILAATNEINSDSVEVATAKTKAIVIIPGMMGSSLQTTSGTDVWLHFINHPMMELNEDGTSKNSIVSVNKDNYGANNYYKTLYNALNNAYGSAFDVIFFDYDFRLNNAAAATKLATELSGYNEVVLVAHSMGGLVASRFLTDSTANRDKTVALITLGTPFAGAAKCINAMETGELIDVVDIFKFKDTVKRVSRNSYGAYQLLPTSNYYNRTGIYPLVVNGTSYASVAPQLKKTEWGKKSDGSEKPMFSTATSFHASLFLNGYHITNYSGVYIYTIAGSNVDTISRVTMNSNYSITGITYNNAGDGTVLLKSAGYGTPDYSISGVNHMDLLSNNSVITKIKTIITQRTGVSASSINDTYSSDDLLEKNVNTNAVNERGWLVGFDNRRINIYTDCNSTLLINGIPAVEDNCVVYNNLGESVGSVWLLGSTGRKMYALYDGEYEVSSTGLTKIEYMNDGYFEKAIEYNDYETMRILISDFKLKSVSCTIKNDQMSPQIAVQPSYVYSDSDLAALNADDIIDGGAE